MATICKRQNTMKLSWDKVSAETIKNCRRGTCISATPDTYVFISGVNGINCLWHRRDIHQTTADLWLWQPVWV